MTRDTRWAIGPLATEVFTAPIPAGAVKNFAATQRTTANLTWLYMIFGFVLAVILMAMPASLHGLNIPAIIIAGLIGMLVVGGIAYAARLHSLSKQWRLWAFTQANGFTYIGEHKDRYNGMIFNAGGGHVSQGVIRTNSVRPVEFGNHIYTTGSGKSQQTHRWGYVAVRIDNFLPHIVLDAEGNNSFFGSNLPVSLAKQQRLSLEGDFDKYFRLFCPVGYERDALYLFTPDVMVRFMDTASELDVEIIDDWVYFYSRNELSTMDAQTWRWLYSVIDTFLAKVEQWERWRDDRLAINSTAHLAGGTNFAAVAQGVPLDARPPQSFLAQKGVAPEGRRLKKGVSWTAVVAVVTFMVVTLFQLFVMRR